MSGLRRRRQHRASDYASILAVLSDMWTHHDSPTAPGTESRLVPVVARSARAGAVVSLAAYRTRRHARPGDVAEAI